MRLVVMLSCLALLVTRTIADPQVGQTWSPFHMTDVGGSPVDWKPGKVTVIGFCAYWCDTWKVQLPRLLAAKGATAGLPVDFVTISVDGRWSEVSNGKRTLPLLLDRGGEMSRSNGVDRVPTTVVLDASGKACFVAGAVTRTEDIVAAIHEALASRPESGSVYLTFDDFPPKDGGEEFLDLLRRLDVKATLFCMGSRIESSAKLLRRAIREGHSLQYHSWDHNAADPQLDKCKEAFTRVLGIEPSLYRAPGSEQIVGEDKHHRIIDPYDFTRPAKAELIRRILPGVCDEAVIQLHAGVAVTADALPELVDSIRQRGFQLAVLSQKLEKTGKML